MNEFRMAHTEYTVADFLGRWDRKELVVNKDYQRSNEVWPAPARSFLIETILIGYPMPKVVLREKTDIKNRVTVSEIVDGQQRTRAIVDFYKGAFGLSAKSEVIDARGLTYEELPDELKNKFLQYRVSADVLVGAGDEQIVELFRRINSYSVSLNPEEKRHAAYQGEMKWMLYRISKSVDGALRDMGVFSDKAFARMQDVKILGEILYSYLVEIKTIKAAQLDDLYRRYDDEFGDSAEVEALLGESIRYLERIGSIRKTPLVSPHNFYALCLAVMHALKGGSASLAELVGAGSMGLKPPAEAETELTRIADALESDEFPEGHYGAMWRAAEKGVNTRENRATRFKYFYEAVANLNGA